MHEGVCFPLVSAGERYHPSTVNDYSYAHVCVVGAAFIEQVRIYSVCSTKAVASERVLEHSLICVLDCRHK